MRYLGLDVGTKRVGVALSDEGGSMAFPKATLANDRTLFRELTLLIETYQVGCVVLGESRDYRGNENPIMEQVRTIESMLRRKTDVAVEFEPEFLTSEEAKRVQGENSALDASAAAIILRSFLDKKHIAQKRNRDKRSEGEDV